MLQSMVIADDEYVAHNKSIGVSKLYWMYMWAAVTLHTSSTPSAMDTGGASTWNQHNRVDSTHSFGQPRIVFSTTCFHHLPYHLRK